MKKSGSIKVFNLFFSMLFISLFAYGCNAEGTPTKEAPPTPETKIDPLNLLKGKLLQKLLDGEMKDMALGMEGSEPISYTMYDVDEDGDKDLFMQAFFQRGEVILDAFVLYYNNDKPEVDPNFKPGFSADGYHQLGLDGGDPRPCDICTFEKSEGDVFTFKDRTNSETLKFKLRREEYIGLSWEKQ